MQSKQFLYLKIISIAMLLFALGDSPYGYYQFLRWVVFGVAGYSAYQFYEKNNDKWIWTMGIIAILYNPIAPINLDKDTWGLIDLVVAGIFTVSFFVENHNTKKIAKENYE